jgi:glycine/D-amino acid oxidase-like deaminating enzyme/nitrite reductase/ring-hydroxylating ferredoxin subunit
LEVDVAIVGAGIAGLSVATLLKQQGKTVAVVDSNRVAAGVSGYTTAKLTSQHSLIYDKLIQNFGEDRAKAYAQANQSAIEQVRLLVQSLGIDCALSPTDAYVFTENPEELPKLRAEAAAAAKLGLPASFVDTPPLPFKVDGAVKFTGQATFHPRRYLLALAQNIPGEGSHIFENTRVTGLHGGEPCSLETETGKVTAEKIVVASHFPLNEKFFYALRMYQHRSYVLGVRLDGPLPDGVFISTEPVRSIRPHRDRDGEILMIGGEGHRTGEGGDTVQRYLTLEEWAKSHFSVRSIDYRWSTQDCQTADGLPYIGRLMPTSEHVFVATGFAGWGMTNGTVAGMLLSDLVLGKDNPRADVYDPNRMTMDAVAGSAKHIGSVATHFVGDRHAEAEVEDLTAGDASISESEEGKVAAYVDEAGVRHELSPVCPHMGCFVQWNPAEKSWDCPCHGSRFGIDGRVLEGPAIHPLKPMASD